MTSNKIWFFTFSSFVFIIAIKLILSVNITETNEGSGNSILTMLYYACDVGVLFIFLINLLFHSRLSKAVFDRKLFRIIWLLLLMVTVGTITSMLNDKNFLVSFTTQLKLLLPFVIMIALIRHVPNRSIRGSIWVLPTLILFLSLYAYIFLDPSQNRMEFFWPVYFSGLHTQAYVVLSAFILLYCYSVIENSRKVLRNLLTVLVFYVIAFGYNVRTAIVCMLIFFVYIFLKRILENGKIKPLLYYLILSFFILTITFLTIVYEIENLETFSSGRISVYVSRISYIGQRNWFQNLIGSGAGSDLMYSNTWWWEEKGSHNDYLTLIIESGIIYLVLFIILIYRLFKFFKNDLYIQAALVTYLTSSIISNGFMFRPLPSYVFFLSLALIFTLTRQKRKFEQNTHRWS